ncbi:hypothetical protein E1A91_A10G221100v1 [Gossypium mustelinum]|uniref:Uncharacterized protein n=1 Tax=Gossypium mustelinum TaxID=34275 RepID=A0A5D2XPT4_GOSMU|nr:hypothetical protein E1A91_A10G221100v1 [Gossypium mustelinum]
MEIVDGQRAFQSLFGLLEVIHQKCLMNAYLSLLLPWDHLDPASLERQQLTLQTT